MILLLTSPVQALQQVHMTRPTIMHSHRNLLPHSTPVSMSPSLASSKLFGTQSRSRQIRRHANNSFSQLHSSTPNGGSSNNAMDAEIKDSESSTSKTSSSSSSSSFLRAVDNFGMKLKPWALNAYEQSLEYPNDVNGTVDATGKKIRRVNRVKSLVCKLQANILWMTYILYRGYRGFFVILPSVFKEVYRQLEESDLVVDVYGDDEEEEKEYAVNPNANSNTQEKQKEPMRLRTRITISVLSMMLTLSYVVSGALRVLGKFIKTLANTTSVESSFEAAAEEVAVNEDKLRNTLK